LSVNYIKRQLFDQIIMKASDEQYLVLLHRALNGSITPDEAQALAQWRQAAPENEQAALTYALIWERSGAYTPELALDVAADFEQVLSKIKQTQPEAGKRSVFSYERRRWLSAAAALLFLLGAVWVFRAISWPASDLRRETAAADQPFRAVGLPDGTTVWLRGGSTIEFPARFEAGERRIHLSGEAFFEVAPEAGRPFRVRMAGGGLIEVLGTAFNARTGAGAQSVLVQHGTVRFVPEKGAEGVRLTVGMRAEFQSDSRKLLVSKRANFNELSWKNGGLEFVATPLKEVVEDISRHYGVQLSLQQPAMGDCLYTAPRTNQPLEKVLQSLRLIYRFRIEQPGAGRYVLAGGACR
jgi:ferric-dicitrate binding protein FerR (iron transport regulator)